MHHAQERHRSPINLPSWNMFKTRINAPFQLVVAVNAIVPPLPLVAAIGAGGAAVGGVTGAGDVEGVEPGQAVEALETLGAAEGLEV